MTQSFNWQVRVYYEDTDAGGVVYHSNYLNFFERARTEWLSSLGFEHDDLQARFALAFVVSHCHIHFRRPATLGQRLDIHTQLTSFKPAKLNMLQTITHQDNTLTEADIVLGVIDTTTGRPKRLPASLTDILSDNMH